MVAIHYSLLTHILFPLYFPPQANQWDPLYTSIATYPNVTFDIIINLDSGPGTGPYLLVKGDNSTWPIAIAKLNSYPNTNLLGYVATEGGDRNVMIVKSQIAQYANWAHYPGPEDIHLNGIFFDQASRPTQDYNSALYAYYETISTYARSLNLPTIALNPGAYSTNVIPYFSLADYIITFEEYVRNYKSSVITQIPPEYRHQSVIILHDLNETGTVEQAKIVKDGEEGGLAGLFITTVEYLSFSKLWNEFIRAVASSVGNSIQW